MESALYCIVAVDNCNVYVGKRCHKLLGCKFLELDVLGVLNDIFNSCIDTRIVLKLEDALLCQEQECSCFVRYIVGTATIAPSGSAFRSLVLPAYTPKGS